MAWDFKMRNIAVSRLFACGLLLSWAQHSLAQLEIEITEYAGKQTPVAVVPFGWEGDDVLYVADAFAARKVDIAFETGQETAATLVEALDELARPNVGVNFDPANMIRYGKGEPVEALRRLAPRVRQIHVKDAVPTETPGTWGCETPAGDGAVAWDAFFDVATTLAPPVDFVIEREAGDERVPDIERARRLIETQLARCAECAS